MLQIDEGDREARINRANYILPDKKSILISDKIRVSVPELLFTTMESQRGSLQEIVYDAIDCVDMRIRSQLIESIVLAGGSTMFHGLPERLKLELKTMIPKEVKIITDS